MEQELNKHSAYPWGSCLDILDFSMSYVLANHNLMKKRPIFVFDISLNVVK